MSESKPTNPKDEIGLTKTPLNLVSGIVKAYHSIALYLGMVKYGAWNYRIGGARASVYKAALDRHMDRWWEGEELDPVDGTPHLANALACISILIETAEGGNLVDDRPPSRDLGPIYAKIERMMSAINERYPDKKPRHYTRVDTPLLVKTPPAITGLGQVYKTVLKCTCGTTDHLHHSTCLAGSDHGR
jgi:hypothetical protein